MKVGTKSVLFGAHCFCLHPLFVARAWWKLFGFPWDPRLWAAFVVHDIGYWGKPNIDGKEGETHVEWGAKVMHRLFDWKSIGYEWHEWLHSGEGVPWRANPEKYSAMLKAGWRVEAHFAQYCGFTLLRRAIRDSRWRDFCLYHSRFYAKKDGKAYSRLCVADKLAIALTPWWLYIPMTTLSGEIKELMALAESGKYENLPLTTQSKRTWWASVQRFAAKWAMDHLDGREDRVTPEGAARK